MALYGWHHDNWAKESVIPKNAKVNKWRLDFRDKDDIRVRETFHGNRTEAKQAVMDRKAAVQRARDGRESGAYVNPRTAKRTTGPTFSEFTGEFLRRYHGRNGRPRSNYYQQGIKVLVPFFGDMLLRDITRARIAQWTATRSESVGPSTLRKNLTALGTILQTAVEWGELDAHPAPKIKKPGEPSHRVQYLTRDQFEQLLAAAPPWLRPMCQLAVHAGLRLKEVTGLRWEDVDLAGGLLYVNPDNKTGRPDPIRLTGAARAVLLELRDRRKALGRELGRVLTNVFVDDAGQDFHHEAVRCRISKVTKGVMALIGSPAFSFISLRHTTASWLAQSGVDLARIREHMRHTNIQTTLRYAHLRPKHLDDVVEALDDSAADGHNMDTA